MMDMFNHYAGMSWLSGEGKNYAWFKKTFMR